MKNWEISCKTVKGKKEGQEITMEYENFYNRYADGCDLSNQSFTDLSLSIDPEAMIFMVGWHAMQSTTSENKKTWFS